jgi:hypothetical protein
MNGGTKSGVSTISLERLQRAMRDFAGPTERRRRRTSPKLKVLHVFVTQVGDTLYSVTGLYSLLVKERQSNPCKGLGRPTGFQEVEALTFLSDWHWPLFPHRKYSRYSFLFAVAQWLRHCATNRKVAGSIPDGVIGIFHSHNPSGRTMALGSTQPLTEMSTRDISWGKGGRFVRLTTLPPSCADCIKIWEPQPPETLRACQGL